MKRTQAILMTLAISGLFVLGSCASLSTPAQFPDDVYGRAAVAQPTPERIYVQNNDDYYEDSVEGDGYYEESYVDGYQDGYYANRLNRFYYYTPGMSYYDPFFDPWAGFSPYGYGRFSFGLGFGYGWGNSWYSPYSSFYGSWGYPYSSWGPYSYYDRFGYGGRYGWGGGYGGYYPYYAIGNTRTIRTRPSNLGTDNIRNRSTRPSRGTVSSANGDRNVRPTVGTRPSSTRPSRNSEGVRPGSATRPTQTNRPGRVTRPSQQNRPNQTRPTQTRPTQSRPTQNRPTQTRPTQTRPAQQSRPTPSYNSGGSRSSSGGGGGGARSSRTRG